MSDRFDIAEYIRNLPKVSNLYKSLRSSKNKYIWFHTNACFVNLTNMANENVLDLVYGVIVDTY